jgi:hypothetical protein
MKIITISYPLAIIMALSLNFACTNSTKNETEDLKDAKENVVDAEINLEKAKKDSVEEYNKYKTVVLFTLTENEKKIAELKEKRKSESATARAKYLKELDALEQKNDLLKSKMNMYNNGAKDKWEAFKKGFNQEVDDLGKAISALATKK